MFSNFLFFVDFSKPSGIRAGRKLRTVHRDSQWANKAYKKKKTVKDGVKERIQHEVLYHKQSVKMYPDRPFDKAYKIKPEKLEPTTLGDYIATIPHKRLEKMLKLKELDEAAVETEDGYPLNQTIFHLEMSLMYNLDSESSDSE